MTKHERTWLVPLICWAGGIALVVGGSLAMVESTAGTVRTDPSDAIATAVVDGTDIAVVVYATDTFPHLDLFRMDSIGMSVQAEAFDLGTGERLWDTMLAAEFQYTGAGALVLGIDDDQVYIAAAEGLMALDARDGRILDRDAEPPELDAATSAEWSAALEAVRTDVPPVFSLAGWDHVSAWAPLPDGEEVPPTWADDGWDVDVLLDAGTGYAAGSEDGFAVSRTYSGSYVLQVGDLRTGERVGGLATRTDASALMDDGKGRVLILSQNEEGQGLLVVATAEGIHGIVIGERGFLGW